MTAVTSYQKKSSKIIFITLYLQDSCRSNETGENYRYFAPRRLTAPPVESEHPEAKRNRGISLYSKQQSLRKQPFTKQKVY